MTEVQELHSVEKKKTTLPLYREVFPEDSDAFLEWYYSQSGNVIFALTDAHTNQVLSMIHCNPCKLIYRGKPFTAAYLYAVATAPAFRHRGYMAALLDHTFAWCRRKGIPFCTLIPVDEAIYTPFAFETICSFDAERSGDQPAMSFDLYSIESTEKVESERQFSSPDDLPENPVVMARITDPDSFYRIFSSVFAGSKKAHGEEPDEEEAYGKLSNEKEMLSFLRKLSISFSQDL